MRVAWVLSLVLLTAEFTGCLGGPEDESAAREPASATSGNSSGVEIGDEVTTASWNHTDLTGDAALRAVINLENETECAFSAWTSQKPEKAGPTGLLLLKTSEGYSWISSSRNHLVQAHALGVDTRNTTWSDGKSAGHASAFGPMEGRQEVTFLAEDLAPWENPLTGNVTFGLKIDCEAPFELEAFGGSRQVTLENAQSMQGGAGATALGLFAQAQTSVLDGFDQAMTTPTVHLLADGFEINGATHTQLDVYGPNDTATWDLSTPRFTGTQELSGGPGTYGVDLRRVAAGQALAFWIALFGHAPLDSNQDLTSKAGNATAR